MTHRGVHQSSLPDSHDRYSSHALRIAAGEVNLRDVEGQRSMTSTETPRKYSRTHSLNKERFAPSASLSNVPTTTPLRDADSQKLYFRWAHRLLRHASRPPRPTLTPETILHWKGKRTRPRSIERGRIPQTATYRQRTYGKKQTPFFRSALTVSRRTTRNYRNRKHTTHIHTIHRATHAVERKKNKYRGWGSFRATSVRSSPSDR